MLMHDVCAQPFEGETLSTSKPLSPDANMLRRYVTTNSNIELFNEHL